MALQRSKRKKSKAKVKPKRAKKAKVITSTRETSAQVGDVLVITAACQRGALAKAGFRQGQKVKITALEYAKVKKRRVAKKDRKSKSTHATQSKNRKLIVKGLGSSTKTATAYIHNFKTYTAGSKAAATK